MGNMQADNCKYTLSYRAYILYYEYEKLQQVKIDSELSLNMSQKTLRITTNTLLVAIGTLALTLVAFLLSIF